MKQANYNNGMYQPKRPVYRYRWLITLFVIMVAVVTLVNYVHAELDLFESAYETVESKETQKENTRVDFSAKEPVTILVIGTQFLNTSKDQAEETGSLFTLTMAPQMTKSVMVQIDPNLVVGNDGKKLFTILRENELDQGIEKVKESVEALTQHPIHYTVAIDLDKIRELVDDLQGLDITMPSTLTIDHETYQAGSSYHLSGRMIEHYMVKQEETTMDHSSRQIQVLSTIFKRLYRVQEVLKWKNYLSKAEYYLVTDLPVNDFEQMLVRKYINVGKDVDKIEVAADEQDKQIIKEEIDKLIEAASQDDKE